jgi:hypothetical protein
MRVLSLDPGESTGYVFIVCNGSIHDFEIVEHGVLSLWRGADVLMDTLHPDVVVCEQFRLYPAAAASQSYSTMIAPRVTGAVAYMCEQRGIPFVEQSASVGKAARLPEKIYAPARGFHTTHEKDALRHAAAYCWSRGIR